MRIYALLSVCLLGLAHASIANVYTLRVRDKALTPPTCSSICFTTYLPKFCGPTSDPSCPCTNQNLTAAITLCASQSCGIIDLLQLQRYTATTCGVPNDKSRLNMVLRITYVIPFLTALFLAGRLLGKILLKIKLGADDWVMVAAFIAYLLEVGSSLGMALNGFGEHIFWLSPRQITNAFKYFYAAELFYILSNTFSKLSLLLFFLRIFQTRTFRLQVYALSLFVSLTGVAFFLALAFQCSPVEGYWTNWDLPRAKKAKCIAQWSTLYAASGLSIFQNVLILILPIPTLWSLELSMRRRINACLMFSVGSGVVVFSFLRLPSLGRLKGGNDLSYDQAPIIVYTHLEQAFGIICACLPSCRSLLEYFFPSLKLKPVSRAASKSHKPHPRSDSSKNQLKDSKRPTSSENLVELRDLESLAYIGKAASCNELGVYDGGKNHGITTEITGGTHSKTDIHKDKMRNDDKMAYEKDESMTESVHCASRRTSISDEGVIFMKMTTEQVNDLIREKSRQDGGGSSGKA